MQTIGIGDIQKNIALLTNLTEAIEIVDKRRKKSVAVVYPLRRAHHVSKLAGKYKDRVSAVSAAEERETAMRVAMEEKYGRTD